MKPHLVTAIMMLTAFLANAQSESLHQSLGDRNGVMTLTLNQSLENFLNGGFDLDDSELHIEGDASRIELSIVSGEADVADIYHEITGKLNSDRYEVVDMDDDEKEHLAVWVSRQGHHIDVIHVLISKDDDHEDDGIIFASLYGDFTVEED